MDNVTQDNAKIKKGDKLTMNVPFFQVPNSIFDHVTNTKHELSPRDIATYCFLARCGNQGSTAFPSLTTIGNKCGMSRRSAASAVKTLIDKGYLKKKTKVGVGNEYEITYKKEPVQNLHGTSAKSARVTSAKSAPKEEPSINENQEEGGSRSHSLLKQFIVNHKQLTEEHYNFTPFIRDRDAKPIKDMLNNADFNFTDDDVLLLQRLYFERPSPNEKENKNPIAWFPLAVNRLQGALAEYKAEIKRSENQAEQRRRDEEEYYRQQELDRKEAERRAALTPEQRQLEDIHRKRKNIFMMLDARISCGRGYSDITERLKELDRAESELQLV